jgi:hypothetical protein
MSRAGYQVETISFGYDALTTIAREYVNGMLQSRLDTNFVVLFMAAPLSEVGFDRSVARLLLSIAVVLAVTGFGLAIALLQNLP